MTHETTSHGQGHLTIVGHPAPCKGTQSPAPTAALIRPGVAPAHHMLERHDTGLTAPYTQILLISNSNILPSTIGAQNIRYNWGSCLPSRSGVRLVGALAYECGNPPIHHAGIAVPVRWFGLATVKKFTPHILIQCVECMLTPGFIGSMYRKRTRHRFRNHAHGGLVNALRTNAVLETGQFG